MSETLIPLEADDPRAPKANTTDLRLPNYEATTPWVLILREGVTVKDATRPIFWSNVARMFDPKYHHFIDVLNEQRTIYARFYVRGVQQNQMIVVNLTGASVDGKYDPGAHLTFGPPEPAQNGALVPRWNVGRRGFDVVRKADGLVVKEGDGFPVKEQALGWIENHLNALGQ